MTDQLHQFPIHSGESPTFQTLAQAVGFIAERLERNAPEELLAAFAHTALPAGYKSFEMDLFTSNVFPTLQQYHQETDLRVRYAGQEFNDALGWHKLGGHDEELGHIHIDFSKTASGWVLEEIWQCR